MNLDDYWANALWSLAPTIGIGGMFWLVIRAVIRADRGERNAYDRIEQELRTELDIERRAAANRVTENEPDDG
jgi:hypothetical protein